MSAQLTQKSQDKYSNHSSPWVAGFSCAHMKVLIVCRGPIRKEAMDVFSGLGAGYGILLSEKDSVTYPYTLAPELRVIEDPMSVHRVPDYTGATMQERRERIQQIIDICHEFGYTHVFAGYGFMAEDGGFVESLEQAGVGFVGPASGVHRQAGAKDMAKVIARNNDVSVTPGVDNITALTLLKKAGGSKDGLEKLKSENNLQADIPESGDLADYAELILQDAYKKNVALITLEELQAEAEVQVKTLFEQNAGYRVRLKYIGGGGGKGQRIVTKPEEVKNAVFEVLSESKAMGPSDNKNFLMELNIENTRHNEIQLIGNGEWSIALGGRDCSLQMHEQKLVEISITDELYEQEIALANEEGHSTYAEILSKDRETLRRMEEQAERFGQAVNLNSASTFECIVSGNDFFFMEMNTRIQVEHRVTEMVYSLKFSNPENADDSFIVESLVEAMALCAAHGKKLPRPERIVRHRAGGEVRLNAMNHALQPAAGGMIEYWSPEHPMEIRDDQGIGVKNPDTNWFIHYHLAGAYDSNIALIITHGDSRRRMFDHLADILRSMSLRGSDLSTNLSFHYGIINFCLGMHPMLKPDTRFVVPYLAAVGSLAREIESFDLDSAWKELQKRVGAEYGQPGGEALNAKTTLVRRPVEKFLADPHAAAGWIFRNYKRAFTVDNGRVKWLRNPLRVLADLYGYFNLEQRENAAPVEQIWPDDQELLNQGLKFYGDLDAALGIDTDADFQRNLRKASYNPSDLYVKLDDGLRQDQNPFAGTAPFSKLPDEMFAQAAASHRGFQAGLQLLDLLVLLGIRSGILDFGVDEQLRPIVPEKFKDEQTQEEQIVYLAPPPPAAADEIVAVTGGMFYRQESPDSPPFVEVGTHFNAGDPLYIIEVMKMFNKVYAEFPGTVEAILLEGKQGTVVKKGDPLFKVKPDYELKIETPEEIAARCKKYTQELMGGVGAV